MSHTNTPTHLFCHEMAQDYRYMCFTIICIFMMMLVSIKKARVCSQRPHCEVLEAQRLSWRFLLKDNLAQSHCFRLLDGDRSGVCTSCSPSRPSDQAPCSLPAHVRKAWTPNNACDALVWPQGFTRRQNIFKDLAFCRGLHQCFGRAT